MLSRKWYTCDTCEGIGTLGDEVCVKCSGRGGWFIEEELPTTKGLKMTGDSDKINIISNPSKGISLSTLSGLYSSEFFKDRRLESLDAKDTSTCISTKEKIIRVCTALRTFLEVKNERYGDSALKPVNVFYKGDAKLALNVRLDDKLSRVRNSKELRKNDVVDLLGYLILICCDNDWMDFKDLLD